LNITALLTKKGVSMHTVNHTVYERENVVQTEI